MRFKQLLVLVLILIGVAWFLSRSPDRSATLACPQLTPPPVVAHAGGAAPDGTVVTNSLVALDHNYARGHRAFEIDLDWTIDQHLVASHDHPTVALTELGDALTVAELMAWLERHPDALIITDVKDHNLRALTYIRDTYPQLLGRLIPQAYYLEEFQPIQELGYCSVILSLYRTEFSIPQLQQFVAQHQSLAITMNTDRARQNFATALDSTDTFTYVHTINSPEEFTEFRDLGIDGVYTDLSAPALFQ